MLNELVEEHSGNIYFDETMIFFLRLILHKRLAVALSSCKDFSTFYDFG